MNLHRLKKGVGFFAFLFSAQFCWGQTDFLQNEVYALFTAGAWDQALDLLIKANADADPKKRELLAMAYLYTANRIDGAGNLKEAASRYDAIVKSGRARFFVSLAKTPTNNGKQNEKEKSKAPDKKYLVEATSGQLIVMATNVQFQPEGESDKSDAKQWEKKDITECQPNDSYGKNSNSFHLLAGAERMDFRPLHFSAGEAKLICGLIVPRQESAERTVAPNDKKKKKKVQGK